MKLTLIKANMTELEIGDKRILFSYHTPVAYTEKGHYYITNKKWSNTTTRHINQWVPGDPKVRPHTIGFTTVSQQLLNNLVMNWGSDVK